MRTKCDTILNYSRQCYFNECITCKEHMIEFNEPPFVGTELQYIQEAIEHHRISGDGPFTKKCSEWMENRFAAKKVMLTTSGSSALDMAALLCGLKPGDEVILPSYTFSSTANAFVLAGASLVFVDIRPDTMNIDETKIESAITEKTKVICVVHYAGVACEMDTILDIAARHGLMVVEDAAQGIMSTYKGKYLGTIGDFGCYSFHETKNYSMGEGGAFVINRDSFSHAGDQKQAVLSYLRKINLFFTGIRAESADSQFKRSHFTSSSSCSTSSSSAMIFSFGRTPLLVS